MKIIRKTSKVIISLLHGLLLFFLLWYINNTSYSTSIDEGLLKKIFIVEDLMLPGKAKQPYDFVFINTSKDINLTRDVSSYGYITITDRRKLADFLKILGDNNNRHTFVLCDIFFEHPSPEDSVLSGQVKRCKKIIFPFHLTNNAVQYSCIPVPAALADYETYNDKFLKFRKVYHDTIKTIPVALHGQLDPPDARPDFLKLNSFSPRYYIRAYQLETHKYPYYNLGELVTLLSKNNFLYNEFLKDKFIVIGNFEADTHITPIGNMYGPLILINSYLSIKNGRDQLSYGWIIFMVISLWITSYILFFVKIEPPKITFSIWLDFLIHSFLNKVFSFIGICTVIVFISELLFSIQITISPLFLYLIGANWVMSYYRESLKQKK